MIPYPAYSGQQLLPRRNRLVTAVLTRRASGRAALALRGLSGVPGCSMRGAGIKSQECAGIQIQPEYIMPSIIAPPLPLPPHLWTGLSGGDRRGSRRPERPVSGPPPPAASLIHTVSARLAASGRKHRDGRENVCGLMARVSLGGLCASASV